MGVTLDVLGRTDLLLDPTALPRQPLAAIYVHVPFCFHKCHYCDFYSITRQGPERMAAFVDRLLAEARQWVAVCGRDWTASARSVFFGGGTPSLLPAGEMLRLVAGLRDVLALGAVDEWTVECNPATVDLAYLQQLRAAGVDRLSFGAQSFDRADLVALERHHDPDDVPRSLDLARSAGFDRLNLDLIFGVPGQSLDSWDRTLRAGLACRTTHVSAYLLTYEENTPLAVKKRLGRVVPAEESLEVEMLRHTRTVLRAAGLSPYEISNFAAPGQPCRHNLAYWNGEGYLGLGPSAASHVSGWRWRNRPHLGEWERAVDSGKVAAAAIETEHLTPDRRESELAYLMIRLARGLTWATFQERTGTDARQRFSDVLTKLAPTGAIEIDATGVRLTEKGIPVADAVGAEFLA